MKRSYRHYLAALTLAVLSLAPGFAAEGQDRLEPYRLVLITVAADPPQGIMPHTIEIVTDPPIRNLTRGDLESRTWTATRVYDFRTDTIRSDTCPQLRAVALSFAELPPLPIRPMASYAAESLPIGPMMKDGYSTSLTFETLASDYGVVTVHLDGWGPYHQWGHQAVSDLRGCWPS